MSLAKKYAQHDETNPVRPIEIFSTSGERLNIYFPILFILLLIIELNFGIQFLSSFNIHEVKFIQNVIFLNTIHNAFSFAMLLGLPELHIWVKEENQRRKTNFWINISLLFVFLIIIFIAIGYPHNYGGGGPSRLHYGILFLSIAIPTYHVMRQTLGLSKVYTSIARKEGDVANIERVDKIETHVLRIIFISFIILTAIRMFPVRTWFPEISSEILDLSWYSLFFISFVMSLGLPIYVLIKEPRRFINKALFLLRVVFIPLRTVSLLAIFASSSVHGIEYGLVFNKMSKNSEVRTKWKKYLFWCLATTGLVAALYIFRHLFEVNTIEKHPHVFNFISAVSIAISFVHNYMDRRLFHMREPHTRKIVRPLLQNK